MSTIITPRRPTTAAVARAEHVSKQYGEGDAAVMALDDVSIGINAQEFTAIMGPSGSGKSTLLHVLAGLDRPTSGTIHIGEVELTRLKDKQLTLLRRDRIGFIFQAFNLLPTLTAAENIRLPMKIAGRKVDDLWFQTVVDKVGLTERLSHRPTELSGGQQQRVAAARALVSQPDIIFADEPTGALDSRSGTELLEFLRQAVVELDQTVVMVTHDPKAAEYASRQLHLDKGTLAPADEVVR
jgi:putative ABC transport system ATP-binding protein